MCVFVLQNLDEVELLHGAPSPASPGGHGRTLMRDRDAERVAERMAADVAWSGEAVQAKWSKRNILKCEAAGEARLAAKMGGLEPSHPRALPRCRPWNVVF